MQRAHVEQREGVVAGVERARTALCDGALDVSTLRIARMPAERRTRCDAAEVDIERRRR